MRRLFIVIILLGVAANVVVGFASRPVEGLWGAAANLREGSGARTDAVLMGADVYSALQAHSRDNARARGGLLGPVVVPMPIGFVRITGRLVELGTAVRR